MEAACAAGGGGMALGSADPHGVGGVDRAPASARLAAYDMAAHAPATEAELAERPFPRTNVAPRTSRAEPPPEQRAGAPVVSSERQVVTAKGLARVHHWQRMLRRAYAAAARGSLS